MILPQVLTFALSNGYAGAEYESKWRGYEVYQPVHEGGGAPIVGMPLVILVKGSEVRMSSKQESLDYLDMLIANGLE